MCVCECTACVGFSVRMYSSLEKIAYPKGRLDRFAFEAVCRGGSIWGRGRSPCTAVCFLWFLRRLGAIYEK